MAELQKFSIMSLNSSGLSNAKRIALEKNIDDMKPDFISLNETEQWISHDFFKTYRMFSHHQLPHHGGVALSYLKNVSCSEIPTFQEKNHLTQAGCAVYLVNKSFILATSYVPPNAE